MLARHRPRDNACFVRVIRREGIHGVAAQDARVRTAGLRATIEYASNGLVDSEAWHVLTVENCQLSTSPINYTQHHWGGNSGTSEMAAARGGVDITSV